MKLENLAKARKARNMTQEETAKRFNVSKTTYVFWENGNHEPSFETLKKLANFFHVSVDYILGEEEKGFTPDEVAKIEEAIKILQNKIK